MVGDGGVTVGLGVEPDLMGACGLAVERKAEYLQALDDLPVAETGEPSHLAADH